MAADHGLFRERPHEFHDVVVGVGEGVAEPVGAVDDHYLPLADLARCVLKDVLRAAPALGAVQRGVLGGNGVG